MERGEIKGTHHKDDNTDDEEKQNEKVLEWAVRLTIEDDERKERQEQEEK